MMYFLSKAKRKLTVLRNQNIRFSICGNVQARGSSRVPGRPKPFEKLSRAFVKFPFESLTLNTPEENDYHVLMISVKIAVN